MAIRKILLLSGFLILVLLGAGACSSQKEVAERRALMMPRKSEMPRNAKKFKEIEYAKRSKHKKKQAKKIKKYNRERSRY